MVNTTAGRFTVGRAQRLLLERLQSHAEIQTVLITLELVHYGVLMKVMKVERHHPLRQSHPELYPGRVHMVIRPASGVRAAVGRNLIT